MSSTPPLAAYTFPPITLRASVVIPCFNERDTVLELIDRVKAAPVDKEIIVVDDFSTDGTRALLQKRLEDRGDIILELRARNGGKGAAVQAGLKRATGDVVIIQDADLEYDPADYPALLDPLIQGKADVVYGSRFLGSRPYRVLYFWNSVGNRLLTFLSNCLTNINLSDMETCYKVFRREIIQAIPIEEDRFGFEPRSPSR